MDIVQANLAKIIEQMPEDFVSLTIQGINEYPKAIDFTNIIGTGFRNYFIRILKARLICLSIALEFLIKIKRRKNQNH